MEQLILEKLNDLDTGDRLLIAAIILVTTILRIAAWYLLFPPGDNSDQ